MKPTIDRAKFVQTAKPLNLYEANEALGQIEAKPREFSTGSIGWGSSGKVTVMIDGQPTPCQVSLNITIIGSKLPAAK